MALTLYGSPRSRTMRVLWTLAELDLAYTHIPTAWDDPALKGADFLALNPAGAIPTLVDDGFPLAESLAINLYLAKTYGAAGAAPLYPSGPEDEASIWRWSLWAQGQLEPWVQQDARLAAMREEAGDWMRALALEGLVILERALADRTWLVGEHFTVADLNVAAVLSPSRAAHLPIGDYPGVSAWLDRCHDRPAARATRARFSA
jgi:glutathione S-transferase